MKKQSAIMADLLQVIQEASAHAEYPSVTIVMPTSKSIPEKLHDLARFKDLVAQAIELLLKDFEKRDVEQLLSRLASLQESYDFSKSLSGLALFVNKSYGVMIPLPFSVKAHVAVGQQFHTADLMHMVRRMKHYWVLELHKDMSRLHEAFNTELHEVITPLVDQLGNPLQGFPLDYVKPEENKQEAYATGDLDARYRDDQLKMYFERVDRELGKVLHAKNLPVVVVGAEKNIHTFEHLTKHAAQIVGYQHGDYLPQDLGPAAFAAFKKACEADVKKLFKKFVESEGALKQAFGIDRVWLSAQQGKIDILLVEEDLVIAGKPDAENPEHVYVYENTVPTGDVRNVVDLVIERVLATGGQVVFAQPGELKEYEKIGAILRFA